MEDNKVPLMVTIQCITYNHEPYIRQCLEGFVMQKANFRFEAIVHDDASTDGTVAIIREYAEKYPDIIKPIYETENQYSKRGFNGVFKIINKHTHGKYVALCEGDDYWIDPLKLQKQVDFLEGNPECSMCCGGFVRREKRKADVPVIENKNCVHEFFFTLQDWGRKWITMPLTIVYRRSYLAEYLQKLDSYKYTRDMHLVYHLLKMGKGIYMSEILAVYRVHSGGMASGVSKEQNLVNNYNCHREVCLHNSNDPIVRYLWYIDTQLRLIYPHPQYTSKDVLKEGWQSAVTVSQKARLLLCFLIPSLCLQKIAKL